MSSKFKIHDKYAPYFMTFTVVGWMDVFSRECYKQTMLDSLSHCIQKKGLVLHAWVIMTNHVHLIASSKEGYDLAGTVRDSKKYTSTKIVEQIADNPAESRKEWMLQQFRFAGSGNAHNKEHQFWKQDYHPIELNTREKALQRLNYLHDNPVRAGIVWEAHAYKYSSAIDYAGGKGLLPVVLLDVL